MIHWKIKLYIIIWKQNSCQCITTKGTSVVGSANHSVQKSKYRQGRDVLGSRACSLLEVFCSKERIENATEVWPMRRGTFCMYIMCPPAHTHTHSFIDLWGQRSLQTVAVLAPLIALEHLAPLIALEHLAPLIALEHLAR